MEHIGALVTTLEGLPDYPDPLRSVLLELTQVHLVEVEQYCARLAVLFGQMRERFLWLRREVGAVQKGSA
jgi:hypothetical protein